MIQDWKSLRVGATTHAKARVAAAATSTSIAAVIDDALDVFEMLRSAAADAGASDSMTFLENILILYEHEINRPP